MRNSIFRAFCCAVVAAIVHCSPAWAADLLSSWNDAASKNAIMTFVEDVTRPGSPDFVPDRERIAVFDNDGTLWPEQPVYFQFAFALDRIKAMAPQHPEWTTKQPFKAVLENDTKALAASGKKGVLEILAATHAGMTTDEFAKIVLEWIATARHPRFNRPYTDLVYQPMLELLAYLRANGFKTFVVSGGGIEFMRPWMEKIYGVPPEQVIGSSGMTEFKTEPDGKPVGINRFIGRRPIFALGNSDGDQQMLEWTAAGEGRRFAGIVHHDDAEREWAYDRESHVGRLDKALDEAGQRGWTVVSMKLDWKNIFPVAPQKP